MPAVKHQHTPKGKCSRADPQKKQIETETRRRQSNGELAPSKIVRCYLDAPLCLQFGGVISSVLDQTTIDGCIFDTTSRKEEKHGSQPTNQGQHKRWQTWQAAPLRCPPGCSARPVAHRRGTCGTTGAVTTGLGGHKDLGDARSCDAGQPRPGQ